MDSADPRSIWADSHALAASLLLPKLTSLTVRPEDVVPSVAEGFDKIAHDEVLSVVGKGLRAERWDYIEVVNKEKKARFLNDCSWTSLEHPFGTERRRLCIYRPIVL